MRWIRVRGELAGRSNSVAVREVLLGCPCVRAT